MAVGQNFRQLHPELRGDLDLADGSSAHGVGDKVRLLCQEPALMCDANLTCLPIQLSSSFAHRSTIRSSLCLDLAASLGKRLAEIVHGTLVVAW